MKQAPNLKSLLSAYADVIARKIAAEARRTGTSAASAAALGEAATV